MCVITLHEDEEGGRRSGNGREWREAAMEGQAGGGLPTFMARRPVCSAAGWRGRTRARRLGVLAALLGQQRLLGHWRTRDAVGVLFGSAAPRIRARHCRAKIGGAAEPCHVTGRDSGRHHVSPLPRHHAWRGTGIWPRQGNRRS